MKIKLIAEARKIKRIQKTITQEFPYYGWWDSKKDDAVRVKAIFYEHDTSLLQCLHVTMLKNRTGINIKTYHINVSKNIMDILDNKNEFDLETILFEFAERCNEKEFDDFFIKIFNSLK